MKKIMVKCLSAICALALTFSICSFSVLAENSVLSAITAEQLAVSNGVNQLTTSVVSNLTLPEIEGVVWESSNPGVIANDGTVTRPMLEDVDVVFTAKAGEETKTFNFTVKARTTNVLYQDSFSYSKLSDFFSESSSSPWYAYGTDKTTELMEENGNKYLSLDFETSSAVKRKIVNVVGNNIYIGVDVMPDPTKDSNITIRLAGTKISDGTSASYTFSLARFYNGTARPVSYNDIGKNLGTYDGTRFCSLNARIDMNNKNFYVSFDGNAEVGPFNMTTQRSAGISASAFSSGEYEFGKMDLITFTRTSASAGAGRLGIDNFSISTKGDVNDLVASLSAEERVNYVKNLITKDSLTSETSGGITTSFALDSGYKNLSDFATVSWTSDSDNLTISQDGKTATVICAEMPETAVLTATISATDNNGTVTDFVKFPFTIAPSGTHKTLNGSVDMDFENYSIGNELGLTTVYATVKSVAEYDSSRNSMVGKFVRTDSSDTRVHGMRIYSTNGGEASWTERYMISLDLKVSPDTEKSIAYVRQMGVLPFNYVGLDYSRKEVILGSKAYGSDSDKRYKLRESANFNFGNDEWVHIDIDFNAAKRETITYINGVAVAEAPLPIDDAYINSAYLMPMRGMDIGISNAGTIMVDNVSVRTFDEPAEVFDENSDFTVQYFAISNQKGESIRNIGPNTTKVIANLRIVQNRAPVSGIAKLFLALYDKEGQLCEVSSTPVTKGTYGYDLVTAEIELQEDYTGFNAKAFLLYNDKLQPLTEEQDLNKEIKFEDELFKREVTYQSAESLGYGMFESERDDNIEAIFFDGIDYLGNPTKHFAYLAIPENATSDEPVPAVVLVHGGGGTAFDEWVKIWLDKGYAAIAIDTNGRVPNNERSAHAWAGATNEYYGQTKLVDTSKDVWMYHTVSEIVLAHNILRADERIDNSRIGITGISWGGIITSTTIGVDKRFAFAIPIYGCGYLYEMDSYMGGVIDEDVVDWDPSNFIAKANQDMPTLWINGDLDGNFAIDGFSKSAELMGDNMNITIKHNMSHGHQAAFWTQRVPEVYSFADSVVKGTAPLMTVSDPVVNGNTVAVTVSGQATSAKLYYTESERLLYDSKGTTPEYSFAEVQGTGANGGTEWTFELPAGAKKFYVTFDYNLGGVNHQASTKFVSLN